MSNPNVRVRFAPSPTGALHIGGVRTLLLNYFFALQHNGKFILRIEDTDQKRFVTGAQEYISECIKWLNIKLDESPELGGDYAPYKQSERTHFYDEYIKILLEKGHAYYAFDTPEELEQKRQSQANWQYDMNTRMGMKNSLTLSTDEVQNLLQQKTPFVIRIKINTDKKIVVDDLIRGIVEFDSKLLDDKILIKAEGTPTYHFAVVVDDYLMKISHVFRGEEWLPSAPIHVLLYEYLGWQNAMPKWIHLPLILKPDGNGKLSKRDGQKFGIPVYALQWTEQQDKFEGFKEKGFLPQALINFLMTISWHDAGGKEILSIEEITKLFNLKHLQHHAAKFDYEKAKWINHQHIKITDNKTLLVYLKNILNDKKINHHYSEIQLLEIIESTKERVYLLNDFYDLNEYLFLSPQSYDTQALAGKWNDELKTHLNSLINLLSTTNDFKENILSEVLKKYCADKQIKVGDIQLPLRIILVGKKMGIGVTHIMQIIGREETLQRIHSALNKITL